MEIVPQAIDDARQNAVRNGIDNAKFYVGKAEEVLPHLYETEGIFADVIVVDPPRKGCDEECLNTILKMQPEAPGLRQLRFRNARPRLKISLQPGL